VKLLRPRCSAASVHYIDYDELWAEGIRGVIFDLDNTLCQWRAELLDQRATELLQRLRARGFRLAVLSNGRPAGRQLMTDQLSDLQVPLIWTARKPWPRGFRRVLSAMELESTRVAMVGDQVFTDVLGARMVGLPTVLVEPISSRDEHPATRVMRCLERLTGRRDPPGVA